MTLSGSARVTQGSTFKVWPVPLFGSPLPFAVYRFPI
jgi:hypothetical protein